jgi:predicted  nucleic acid-binding Zn-ribbon protein
MATKTPATSKAKPAAKAESKAKETPAKKAGSKAKVAEEPIEEPKTKASKKVETEKTQIEEVAETKSAPKAKKSEVMDVFSVEGKLKALYELQYIDSQIDRIKTIRGELPLEVRDLEDELAGLETRVFKLEDEIGTMNEQISDRKNAIKEAQALIKKYEGQQQSVRNSREYDSLSKEIEYQTLDIQLSEKRIKEFKAQADIKTQLLTETKANLDDRQSDLDHKKGELDEIIAETRKEEEELSAQSKKAEGTIEPRLVTAYKRLRSNALNGLAVVPVQRDACGGCFNKIPPQRQLDIRLRKKIIVCEYCGRILVDPELAAEVQETE